MGLLLGRFCVVVLVVVFGWAALAKVMRFSAWRSALETYGFSAPLRRVATVGVPVAEGAVTGLLVSGRANAGAALVLALLACFSLALARVQNRAAGRVPCGCFGRTGERSLHLVAARNALLAAAAGIVLTSGLEGSPVPAVEPPRPQEAVPVGLALAGLLLCAWTAFAAAAALRTRDAGDGARRPDPRGRRGPATEPTLTRR